MISYFQLLVSGASRQAVVHDHGPHLLYLILLRLPAVRPRILDLLDSGRGEEMMTAAKALVESAAARQVSRSVAVRRREAGVRSTARDPDEKGVALGHD